jgi:hypothetical protein
LAKLFAVVGSKMLSYLIWEFNSFPVGAGLGILTRIFGHEKVGNAQALREPWIFQSFWYINLTSSALDASLDFFSTFVVALGMKVSQFLLLFICVAGSCIFFNFCGSQDVFCVGVVCILKGV